MRAQESLDRHLVPESAAVYPAGFTCVTRRARQGCSQAVKDYQPERLRVPPDGGSLAGPRSGDLEQLRLDVILQRQYSACWRQICKLMKADQAILSIL